MHTGIIYRIQELIFPAHQSFRWRNEAFRNRLPAPDTAAHAPRALPRAVLHCNKVVRLKYKTPITAAAVKPSEQ